MAKPDLPPFPPSAAWWLHHAAKEAQADPQTIEALEALRDAHARVFKWHADRAWDEFEPAIRASAEAHERYQDRLRRAQRLTAQELRAQCLDWLADLYESNRLHELGFTDPAEIREILAGQEKETAR